MALRQSEREFIKHLRAGWQVAEAARLVGVAVSVPYTWAKSSPAFDAAWKRVRRSSLRYCRRAVKIDVVDQFLADLHRNGFIASLDLAGEEELRTWVVRFFAHHKLLEARAVRIAYNRSPVPRERQKQLVDMYIKLKAGGANCNRLHEFLVEHGVSDSQISTWAMKWRGRGALLVGPYVPGRTRERLLEQLQKGGNGPRSAQELADALEVNMSTARLNLNQLFAAGKIIKHSLPRGRVTYARA